MKTRKIYNHEPDIYGPRICLDYDPVLRRWNHPPPRWLWWYERKREQTKWDTIAGIVGTVMLGVAIWVYVALVF